MTTALTHGYGGFLRRRHTLKHFARHPLTNALAGRGPLPAAPEHLASHLLLVARDTPAAAIARLAPHADGLSARESGARLKRSGFNEVARKPPQLWWLHLWHCYKNPFNLLLTVLAAVSYLSAHAMASKVIGAMVGLSTLIRFVQEGRSHRAAESLKAMVSNNANVIRRAAGTRPADVRGPPVRLEVPMRTLAPGDIVALSAGDMIPADCRVLSARDLFIAQARHDRRVAAGGEVCRWPS